MPALSRAVATTGPAIPPPMTSAVRTLDVVAVDMGSLLHVVFVGRFCAEITHGSPAILWLPPRGRGRLVGASVRGRWAGMGASSRPGVPAAVLTHRPGAIESSSRLLGPFPRVRPAPG